MFIENPKLRKAIYAILAAAGAGAVAYGVIDQSTASMLVGVLGSLLLGQSALAGGNVTPRVPASSIPVYPVDVPAVADRARDIVLDAVGEAQAQVDAARADLERRIGLGR